MVGGRRGVDVAMCPCILSAGYGRVIGLTADLRRPALRPRTEAEPVSGAMTSGRRRAENRCSSRVEARAAADSLSPGAAHERRFQDAGFAAPPRGAGRVAFRRVGPVVVARNLGRDGARSGAWRRGGVGVASAAGVPVRRRAGSRVGGRRSPAVAAEGVDAAADRRRRAARAFLEVVSPGARRVAGGAQRRSAPSRRWPQVSVA